MSFPLQNISKEGMLYQRRPEVEVLIDKLEDASRQELLELLLNTEEIVPMEVFLYFLRGKICTLTPILYKEMFLEFVRRIEGSLQRSIPDWKYSKAEQASYIRQEILEDFVELIALDRNEGNTKLDYFEVNFNSAFRTFRINVLRKIGPAGEKDPLADAVSIDDEADSDIKKDIEISSLEINKLNKSILDDESFRISFLNAINQLPDDQRRVIGLYLQGLPIESKDADKATISSILGCTDRTVRNRLKRAYSALKDKLLLEEEL